MGLVFTALSLLVILLYTAPLLVLVSTGEPSPPPFNLPRVLAWTLLQATAAATLSTLIGWPIGVLAGFYGHRLALAARSAGLPVFMAPSVAVVLGFTVLYGEAGLGRHLPPLRVLAEGWTGVIAVHAYYNIPLAIMLTYSSAVASERTLLDLVRVSGRPWHTVWLRVLLPLTLRGALAAWLLAFIFSFTGLAAPLMLHGAAYRYYTLEAWIYTLFYGFPGHLHTAAWLALLQTMLLVLAALLFIALSERAEAAPRLVRPGGLSLGKTGGFVASLYTLTVLVFLYMPLITVFYTSLNDPYRGWVGLDNYLRLVSGDAPIPPMTSFARVLVNTAFYAIASSLLAVFGGLGLALAGSRLLASASFTSLTLSPVVLGLAIYLAYYHPLSSLLPAGLAPIPLIVLSHTAVALPLSARAIWLGLTRLRRELVELLVVGGVRGLRLALTLLQLAPSSVMTGLLLAMVASLGEFGATLVLSTPQTWSLGILVYHLYGAGRVLGLASAACSILLGLVFLISILGSRWLREWM